MPPRATPPCRRTVSFIFQTFNLFPALTALENVEFGADVSGHGNARALAAETLGTVDASAIRHGRAARRHRSRDLDRRHFSVVRPRHEVAFQLLP